MKTLYLDCFAGIAGDMFLGAIIDLGLFPVEDFIDAMKGLALDGYSISVEKGIRKGIAGTDIKVIEEDHNHHDEDHHHHHHHHHHRHLSDIIAILDRSTLPEEVRSRSALAFRLLAEAEAEVHGTDAQSIHFHEVGAIDSIVDVVGGFMAVHMAGIDRVYSSPINVGSGTVKCAHGVMPVPAPATAKLLTGMPIVSQGDPIERTTPTGALILKVLCDSFGTMPSGTIKATGHGLGDKDTDLPNLLRVTLIEEGIADTPWIPGQASVLEANLDDMNPQDLPIAMDHLFKAGAWDVFFTPITMKKNRPGVRITCVGPVEQEEKLAETILKHTTSIGVRCRREH
ncbi:MAG: nickel pincer cofactor biosynthesis protein LarC, partial [Dethiosulfovibrio sp.]|nr:nickel pincer cofactor biosynthesis protein LarC [Dethiosulfovibrio sp.]